MFLAFLFTHSASPAFGQLPFLGGYKGFPRQERVILGKMRFCKGCGDLGKAEILKMGGFSFRGCRDSFDMVVLEPESSKIWRLVTKQARTIADAC